MSMHIREADARKLAEHDAQLYGQGFYRKRGNGLAEHIPATAICVIRGAKPSDQQWEDMSKPATMPLPQTGGYVTPDQAFKAAQGVFEKWFCEDLGLDLDSGESERITRKMLQAAGTTTVAEKDPCGLPIPDTQPKPGTAEPTLVKLNDSELFDMAVECGLVTRDAGVPEYRRYAEALLARHGPAESQRVFSGNELYQLLSDHCESNGYDINPGVVDDIASYLTTVLGTSAAKDGNHG